jgi:Flp pilus assembly pilin Flp
MYAYLYLRNLLDAIKKGEEGQDLIEYALIVLVLVLVAVAGMGLVGDEIAALWDQIVEALQGNLG